MVYRETKLNANKANKSDVHNLKGTNPNNADLLNWASDNAKRLSLWKIIDTNVTGFPSSSSPKPEWCTLNLQDETGTRGVVLAFEYNGLPGVKYRCYYNKSWLTDWVSII
ncbi:hypothetical protein AALB39_27610 [Lachnospiraceae bacterium 54-53]